MFDLNDMMKHAQGGQAMLNLARHFGLTPDQTAKIVEAVMPAFVTAMQRQMSDPAAAMKLMATMFQQSGPKNPYLDALSAFTPETKDAGEKMIGLMFGNKDVAAAVNQHIANMTGMGQQVLASMMPVLAAMTAGGLGSEMAKSPFAKMMEPFMAAQPKAPAMPDFSAMFSPKAAETGMAEMMKAWSAMGIPGFEPEKLKTMANPAGPGTPIGDMMAEFMKSLSPAKPEPAPKKAPEPEPAKDVFSQMMDAGKDAQAQGTQAFEEIFDRFWGRKK